MGIFLKDLDKHYTYDPINDIWNRTGIRVQQIKAISSQSGTRTGTTQSINIPNGSISAGNIICIAFSISYNPGTGGANMSASGYVVGNGGNDLNIPSSEGNSTKTQTFYRVATGSEGSTLTINHNTTAASGIQDLWFSTVYVLDIGNYNVNYSGTGTNISIDGISCVNFVFGHGGLYTPSTSPFINNVNDVYTENGNLIFWTSLLPATSSTLFSWFYFVNPRKQPSGIYNIPIPEIGGGSGFGSSNGNIYEAGLYAT